MSLLERILSESLDQARLVDIWRDRHRRGEALFGRFIQQSENLLCLVKYDGEGEYDGISILRKEDITSLRWGGRENQCIQKLIEREYVLPRLPEFNLSGMREAIGSVFGHFGYVALHMEDIDEGFYLGEISDSDDDFVLLNEYGTKRSMDRSHYALSLDEITLIEADGKYERKIYYLHQLNDKTLIS